MTIDAAIFRELQDNVGAEFVEELVQTFLHEAPAMFAELHGAWAAGSAERFRRAAHSLKSNGQTFGATDFAQLAKALELGGLPPDDAPFAALERSYEAAAQRLVEMSRA